MKRPLLTILLFLLLGAVANVAVAWGCVVKREPELRDSIQRYIRSGGPETAILTGRGELLISQWNGDPTRCFLEPVEFLRDEEYERLIPRWSAFHGRDPVLDVPRPKDRPILAFSEYACGRPFLSLRCHVILWFDGTAVGKESLVTAPALPVSWLDHPPWGLPLGPIWPGFAINTVFYSTLLWPLILGPFALRRFIRRKRGRCSSCGYPAGESAACSECGKQLPKGMIAAP